jgi:hypothetical protein
MIQRFNSFTNINENMYIKDKISYLKEIGYGLKLEKGIGTGRKKEIITYRNESLQVRYTLSIFKIWTETMIEDYYGESWKGEKEAVEKLGTAASDIIPLQTWLDSETETEETAFLYVINEFKTLFNALDITNPNSFTTQIYSIQDHFNIESVVSLLNAKNITIVLNKEWEYLEGLIYRWYQTAKAIDYMTTGEAAHGYMSFDKMKIKDFQNIFLS